MRRAGWQERLQKLDETMQAFRLMRRGTEAVEGWIRTVRQSVGLPLKTVAARMGCGEGEVCRLEGSERRGAIEIGTLRKAAAALGCELVYGLVPRERTLAEMAAQVDAEREQKRAQARKKKRERDRRRRWKIAGKPEEAPTGVDVLKKAVRKLLRKEGLRIRNKAKKQTVSRKTPRPSLLNLAPDYRETFLRERGMTAEEWERGAQRPEPRFE